MSRLEREQGRRRYSKAVVRSMEHAKQLSLRYNHAHLGSEHLLGGLLVEESGAAGAVLRPLGADPQRLNRQLLQRLAPGADMVTGSKLPRTACLAEALDRAGVEADALGHTEVDVRHVLIGLACGDGLAAEVLRQHGVTADALRGSSAMRMRTSSVGDRAPGGNGAA